MDIHFCDLCNESVPQSDLDLGRAHLRRGRVICSSCERAMTHAEGSGSHGEAASGGVALQAEIAQAIDIFDEEPRSGNAPSTGSPSLLSTPAAEVSPSLAEPSPAFPSASTSGASSRTSGFAGAASAPGDGVAVATANAPRSTGLVVGVVALLFAAGAAAVLHEEIGEVGARDEAIQGKARAQEKALDDLSKSNREARAEVTALQTRLASEMASGREVAEKALSDLRTEAQRIQAATLDLGKRVDDLSQSGVAHTQDLDRKSEEIAAALAKSRDDGRVLQERLAKLEDQAQHVTPPTATPGAPAEPTASRLGALVADLQSPKAATRWEAVDQIGQTGDPQAVPYLLPVLKDVDVFVRMATARVLGDLKVTSAVPALIDALEDSEAAVREAALGALRTLTGKDLRFDPMASESERAKKVKAWREWWKKTEEEGGLGKSQG